MLTDRMKKDKKVGAVSSRIHPIGSGPLIWYQVIPHFLLLNQKKNQSIFSKENGICNVLLVTKNNRT
jgi:hypothetical protein